MELKGVLIMKKVKVGIVGLGRLGIEHARNIAFQIPNAELTAVCSIDSKEVDSVQKKWAIPYGYTEFEDLIKNEELDAIAIVSPSPQHCEQAIASLDAGYHVFTEKPVGLTVEECERVEEAVERNEDKVFMLGFMRR